MLQDIGPRIFDNTYSEKRADPGDIILSYSGDQVLVREKSEKLCYPSFADLSSGLSSLSAGAQFLFSIDGVNYFLVHKLTEAPSGWTYVSTARLRVEKEHWRSFAGALGWQLYRWYRDHVYCSRCREPLEKSKKERMLFCESCGLTFYPSIHPCVIVGVYDGDKLLLTQYANRPQRRFALVAGFTEVGESLEQTVRREVLEEVGLRVKNIRFYKSQPWPFSDSLLAGFFAELEGDSGIRLDEEELAMGLWMPRGEIPKPDNNISLTGEMIDVFRKKTWNFETKI